MARKVTKKAKAPARKSPPKLKRDESVVKDNWIYCVNSAENATPFWGGHTCDNRHPYDGSLVRWTCSECVAAAMPAPPARRQAEPVVIDAETGVAVRRKRGRPRKHPAKPVELDDAGQPVKRGRGRPKGAKNAKTIEKEKMIEEGLIQAEPKRPRGRPKGSKNVGNAAKGAK